MSGFPFDEAAVARHIHRIFRPYLGEQIRVGYMTAMRPVPGQKKPELTEVRRTNLPYPTQIGEIVRRMAVAAGQGREIYLSPMPWTNERQQAPQGSTENLHGRCWWLWGDIDGGDHEKLRPTVLVETSPGRFAGLWQLAEPIAPEAAAELSARIAVHIGGDPSGADLTQVLRIPGTANLSRPGCPAVRLVDDEGPVYEAAILAEMLPPAPRRSRPSGNHCGSGEIVVDPEDQEPPVPLDAASWAVWKGENPIVNEDGVIDRSRTLMRIGRRLYDNGLATRYLAAELAATDARLGYRKYSERPDAAMRYAEMAAAIVGDGRRGRLVRLPAPSGNDCSSGADTPEIAAECGNEACRLVIEQLRQENDRLRLRERGRRNRKGLGAAATGAAEIAQAVADAIARHPVMPEGGLYLDVFALERETGIEARQLRQHAKTVAKHPMSDADCERFGVEPGTSIWRYDQKTDTKWVTTPDGRRVADGTVVRPFILPNVAAVQEAVATATLPKAPRPGNPGCKLHPGAPTYVQKTVQEKIEERCSECHEVIRTETRAIRSYVLQPAEAEAVAWSPDEDESPSGNDCSSGEIATEGESTPLSSTVAETVARGPRSGGVGNTRGFWPNPDAVPRAGAWPEAQALLDRLRSAGFRLETWSGVLYVSPEDTLPEADRIAVYDLRNALHDLVAGIRTPEGEAIAEALPLTPDVDVDGGEAGMDRWTA